MGEPYKMRQKDDIFSGLGDNSSEREEGEDESDHCINHTGGVCNVVAEESQVNGWVALLALRLLRIIPKFLKKMFFLSAVIVMSR